MSDENTTDSPPGNVPDIPPKPVEAAQTATTDVVEISATDLPSESTEATPPTTTDAEGNSTSIAKETSSAPIGAPRIEESRSESRTHVRWHVDAFVDGQNVHHGFIKDISLKGADIFLSLSTTYKMKNSSNRIFMCHRSTYQVITTLWSCLQCQKSFM